MVAKECVNVAILSECVSNHTQANKINLTFKSIDQSISYELKEENIDVSIESWILTYSRVINKTRIYEVY